LTPALSQTRADPARQTLFDCIQQLAVRSSNPVLEVLQGVSTLEQNTKYPVSRLSFAQQGLRAFYHCHDSVQRPANEHGHFHLFVCADVEADIAAWAHLAALAMDDHGQPIQWFSVNRWVTGGQWLTADTLVRLLSPMSLDTNMLLVEQWLLALLKVCQAQLQQLLIQRDKVLTQLMSTSINEEAIWQDRRYYEFSKSPVDLLALFQ